MHEAWREADDWYWAGPEGWTIFRVFVGNAWLYELWKAGYAGRVTTANSLADALKQHETFNSDRKT